MPDAPIGDLDRVSLIQDQDLFVLEQNGVAKSLLGSLLKQYIDRNLLSISIQELDISQGAQVISFNASTGALVIGIPRAPGISDIQKINTEGIVDTYQITFEAPHGGTAREPITFEVRNGLDGSGSVRTVNNVSPDSNGNVTINVYVKPSGGIPKTDLAQAVQTSLGLADSALQAQGITGKIDKSTQTTKTSEYTENVAIDSDGKLWVKPTNNKLPQVSSEMTNPIYISAQQYVAQTTFTFTPPTGYVIGAIAYCYYDPASQSSGIATIGANFSGNTVSAVACDAFGGGVSGNIKCRVLFIPSA